MAEPLVTKKEAPPEAGPNHASQILNRDRQQPLGSGLKAPVPGPDAGPQLPAAAEGSNRSEDRQRTWNGHRGLVNGNVIDFPHSWIVVAYKGKGRRAARCNKSSEGECGKSARARVQNTANNLLATEENLKSIITRGKVSEIERKLVMGAWSCSNDLRKSCGTGVNVAVPVSTNCSIWIAILPVKLQPLRFTSNVPFVTRFGLA
jgi:hypothetical protein